MADANVQIEAWLRERGVEIPPARLAEIIPVHKTSPTSPLGIIDDVEMFQYWAENEAYLKPGEYPYAAWLTSVLNYYVGQVNNGGHDQWIANLRFNDLWIDATGFGLRLMELDAFHAIWSDYERYARSEKTRTGLRERWGFGPRDDASGRVDTDFFQLGSIRMMEGVASWLWAQPCIREMEPSEIAAEKKHVLDSNTQRDARIAEQALERERNDLLAVIVRELCRKANVTPKGVLLGDQLPTVRRTGAGPELTWGVHTDKGQFLIDIHPPRALFGQPKAVLVDFRPAKRGFERIRITDMSVSKQQYSAILDWFAISRRG